jgi:hypothetical protein
MMVHAASIRVLAHCAVLGALVSLAGCGSKEPPAQPAPAPAPAAEAPATAAPPATADTAAAAATPVTAAEVTRTWTPEEFEQLLAPIALYPDPVLSQVLIASTNPQEVLDAGNWLLQNQGLEGKALDDAAAAVGFTPPVRALVQFPETVDMMCLELGWTTELGEAFVADQAGTLAAVQRLRKQAIDVGNLQSSDQMKVETQKQEGQEVVVLKPAKPEVVYVPQYDPVAAYAPPPATTAPAATTTTTTTTEAKGHSTGSLVATGLLAFGAGILVNELFDDDDDYYYPNYGYGGMPYYPPYPYRPAYGGGYYPSNGYNRPPGYNSGFVNTGNIVINTGGGGGYWDRYDNQPGRGGYQRPTAVSSPITAARPNRPELNELNQRQPRAKPADARPPSADRTASNWKGQSGYAGAKPGASKDAQSRIANAQPKYSKPATPKAGTRDVPKAPPKVQGSYAGAKPDRARPSGAGAPATRDVQKPKPATRDVQRPQQPSTRDVKRPPTGGDRGYSKPAAGAKPAARPQPANRPAQAPSRGTAVSGGRSGQAERAASQRGKQSMPQGARSKGGGGGGGGSSGKQRR